MASTWTARLASLSLVLAASFALRSADASQVQVSVDSGASILRFDGIGGGALVTLRGVTGRGFHAGGGGGVDVLHSFQLQRRFPYIHGEGVVGGTVDPSALVRLQVEAMIGAGYMTDGVVPGSVGGVAGGVRFQALSRFALIGFPRHQRDKIGVGFFISVGVGAGTSYDVIWAFPQGRVGLTLQFGRAPQIAPPRGD